jgi:hypothetical protein
MQVPKTTHMGPHVWLALPPFRAIPENCHLLSRFKHLLACACVPFVNQGMKPRLEAGSGMWRIHCLREPPLLNLKKQEPWQSHGRATSLAQSLNFPDRLVGTDRTSQKHDCLETESRRCGSFF